MCLFSYEATKENYRVKGEWFYTCIGINSYKTNGEGAEEEHDHLIVKDKDFEAKTGNNRSESHTARWIKALEVSL